MRDVLKRGLNLFRDVLRRGLNLFRHVLKRGLNLSRSLEVVIILVILMLFISGFGIFIINRPNSPSFYIYDAFFRLGEDTRNIELYVKVDEGSIELKQFFLNNNNINEWTADKNIIREGEVTICMLEYPWKVGKYYDIKLVTTDDRSADFVAKAPEVIPSLRLEIKNVNVTMNSKIFSVNATYEAYSNGTDSLHMLLLTYKSFENEIRPAFVFYDSHYMTEESLKRADAIISHFGSYNVTIEKVDYGALEYLSNSKPKCILIIVNPLKDLQGNKIENAIPAPLVDIDGDGFIKDDSEYGKTRLYDWMQDNGLILVTVGSLQPYKRIVYRDGIYNHALDSTEMFDAHLLLTEASNEGSIINGSFVLGAYSAVRISGTLGLSDSESSFGFDKDDMERHRLRYYGYGDYNLSSNQVNVNLTLPVFIRVAEDGGWLAMGDGNSGLSSEQLAHDLFIIYLQSIWDSEWVPYGWYWDSASTFDLFGGELTVSNSLETSIPTSIVGDKIVVGTEQALLLLDNQLRVVGGKPGAIQSLCLIESSPTDPPLIAAAFDGGEGRHLRNSLRGLPVPAQFAFVPKNFPRSGDSHGIR